ncbi:MAG: hypothetical protein R2813_10920 [Flavobacteriales bacterium]
MNLQDRHTDSAISTYQFFKGEIGLSVALQIKAGERLKEHTSNTEAVLLCISGLAQFDNQMGLVQELRSGDFVVIEALVAHRVIALETSQFILFK